MPPLSTPSHSDILSGSRSSRLYRSLVLSGKALAASTYSSYPAEKFPRCGTLPRSFQGEGQASLVRRELDLPCQPGRQRRRCAAAVRHAHVSFIACLNGTACSLSPLIRPVAPVPSLLPAHAATLCATPCHPRAGACTSRGRAETRCAVVISSRWATPHTRSSRPAQARPSTIPPPLPPLFHYVLYIPSACPQNAQTPSACFTAPLIHSPLVSLPTPAYSTLNHMDEQLSAEVAALAGGGPTADELRRYKKARGARGEGEGAGTTCVMWSPPGLQSWSCAGCPIVRGAPLYFRGLG